VAQSALIQKGHWLKTTMRVRAKIKRIVAGRNIPRTKMVQQQERINLRQPLGRQRLVNLDRTHPKGVGGKDIGNGTVRHNFI
jgi:hypothetical protein